MLRKHTSCMEGAGDCGGDPPIPGSPIQPLCFKQEPRPLSLLSENADTGDIICLFCDQEYSLDTEKDEFLGHMVIKHKFVIADVKFIVSLRKYIEYWRERFEGKELTDYCSVLQINSKPTDIGPQEKYYLLCDALPADKELRESMQRLKLEQVLETQKKEREDASFNKSCLFCREQFKGNRSALFSHMISEHHFNVGRPDNLVYTDEFIGVLKEKLNNKMCLYCERTFKDRPTLIAHMRKKNHKKINPKNTAYDKYYIINYLELGKNWKVIQSEEEGKQVEEDEDNEDWSDWQEEGGAKAVCLFCDHDSDEIESLFDHMKETHKFDLCGLRQEKKMTFYQQIKLVNYIRRQMHQLHCCFCDSKFKTRDDLQDHMTKEGHMGMVPEAATWDQPQYFFPTYENDSLLYALDVEDEDANAAAGSGPEAGLVVAEDNKVTESILIEEKVRRELMGPTKKK